MADNKINPKEKVGTPDERTASDLAADYQWSMALLNSHPDLRKKFRQAVTNDWSPARFTAEIQDTEWFKKHAASWRQNEIQRLTDPATWEAGRKAARAELEDQAAKMGAVLSPSQIKKVADSAMAFGWNQSQINNALASYVKVINSGTLKGQYIGQAGEWNTQLMAAARANGYTLDEKKAKGWLAEIVRGDATVEDYQQMMRRRAAEQYPAWSDELLAGSDLDDLIAPYRRSMAALLELPENKVSLNDKLLRKALSHRDAKGKAAVMPLHDFEDQIRSDKRWQFTDNAHEEIMGQVMSLGQMFGKTGR